jgi:hypothetical protein
MNVRHRRKMTALLSSLGIPQAGVYHAFRHFNVAMLDALRVPLKADSGELVMLSPMYSRWTGKAVSLNGDGILKPVGCSAELEKAVNEAVAKLQNLAEVDVIDGLSPYKEKGSGAKIS